MTLPVVVRPCISAYQALVEPSTRLADPYTDCKEALATSDDPFDPVYGCPEDFDKSYYRARPINQWPDEPADYRAVMDEYRAAVLDFSKRFLRIIALALDLEEGHFDHMTRFPMAGLRALHYPPQETSTDVGIGGQISSTMKAYSLTRFTGAHNDYSWFTLVWQMTAAPALEVLNKNGEWISAPPVPNALTVNV